MQQNRRGMFHKICAKIYRQLFCRPKMTQLQQELDDAIELVNNVSHEVRAALHGICSICTSIESNFDNINKDLLKTQVQHITEISDKTAGFLVRVMDLSKLRSTEQINHDLVNFTELAQDVLKDCETLYLNGKNLTLNYVSNESTLVSAFGDKALFRQLLINLIHNSIKYSDAGKVEVQVGKAIIHDEEFVKVSVQDEGRGIPENELEKVFNSFFRSTKTRGEDTGIGLGLAFCKKIVELYHGKIWANRIKKGCKISFVLPLVKEYPLVQQPRPQSKTESTETTSLGDGNERFNILLIDDEELCHNLVKILVMGTEFDVTGVFSATEAEEFMAKHHSEIDLILLDVSLPEMSGYDLYDKLCKDGILGNIPVIIQSGFSRGSYQSPSLAPTKCHYIEKPYKHDQLLAALREAMLVKFKSKSCT